MVSCLITNSIYDKVGIVQSWKDVWMLVQDPIYKNVEKASRKVVFSVSSNNRPIGEKSFSMWNGIQIIDIDIKNKKIANELKLKIFEDLNKYHWFLGVAKSASGKSLHVRTPPHRAGPDAEQEDPPDDSGRLDMAVHLCRIRWRTHVFPKFSSTYV